MRHILIVAFWPKMASRIPFATHSSFRQIKLSKPLCFWVMRCHTHTDHQVLATLTFDLLTTELVRELYVTHRRFHARSQYIWSWNYWADLTMEWCGCRVWCKDECWPSPAHRSRSHTRRSLAVMDWQRLEDCVTRLCDDVGLPRTGARS